MGGSQTKHLTCFDTKKVVCGTLRWKRLFGKGYSEKIIWKRLFGKDYLGMIIWKRLFGKEFVKLTSPSMHTLKWLPRKRS